MFEIYEFTLKNEKNSGLFQHMFGVKYGQAQPLG